ncbi:unnamed protein product [Callosobruchus maculatus]|uniref:Uncharacterized protein n=1 Tax=Callosobruchus maculatus TaxID=64391 RepID=A0A653C7G6_CALMS|nr:unnamed protein product [Callosobruchus maculatus]
MSRQCPVAEKCRSMSSAGGGSALIGPPKEAQERSMNAQIPETADAQVQPANDVTVFEKAFMDALVEFMRTTHAVMERWKIASGGQELQMSEEERQAKAAELMQMIEQKQNEIQKLQQQKEQLLGGGANKTYFAQTRSGTVYCIQECEAECADSNAVADYDEPYPAAGYGQQGYARQMYPPGSGFDLSCVPNCTEPCNLPPQYPQSGGCAPECYIRPSGR